jgi:hypothetical protein
MLALLAGARHVHLPNAAPSLPVQEPELAMHAPPQPLPPTPAAKDTTAQNCLKTVLKMSPTSEGCVSGDFDINLLVYCDIYD